MENKDVISLSLDVVKIMLGVCILIGLASLAYEVKPLINEIEGKLDSLEMPDFSSVNELMMKVDPLLELASEFNDPTVKYYFQEFKYFLARFDEIQGSDLTIELLPSMQAYYVNESWRD